MDTNRGKIMKNESEDTLTNSCLPDEIIFDILSYVPLKNRKRAQVFFRKGVAYCIWFVETDDDIDILDMENESHIGHTAFAIGFFHKLSSNVRLSFAEIVKDGLHVLVLEDYRN
ncbi:hypothetical protein RND71_041967 [Anisodus tanguticus]|uniref:F-box domain-containing protein n=1 Tax=Anisodus tanguticus TaxID=243964 RepID=A0AAE1QVP6_9SOLA|nr:hypothetical protein RND71_041967 [Anisodus tanguticus]